MKQMGTNYFVNKYFYSYNLKYGFLMVVSSVLDTFLQLNNMYQCLNTQSLPFDHLYKSSNL